MCRPVLAVKMVGGGWPENFGASSSAFLHAARVLLEAANCIGLSCMNHSHGVCAYILSFSTDYWQEGQLKVISEREISFPLQTQQDLRPTFFASHRITSSALCFTSVRYLSCMYWIRFLSEAFYFKFRILQYISWVNTTFLEVNIIQNTKGGACKNNQKNRKFDFRKKCLKRFFFDLLGTMAPQQITQDTAGSGKNESLPIELSCSNSFTEANNSLSSCTTHTGSVTSLQ